MKVSHEVFVSSVKAGDVGLLKAENHFAWFQDLYRRRMGEGDQKASHGFIVKEPPMISEANGPHIQEATFLKNIGSSTRCWFFRLKEIKGIHVDKMMDYCRGSEETDGIYSVHGILEFIKSFLFKKRDWKDRKGVFCSEYVSRIIIAAGLGDRYITTRDPWEISPSFQLNWLCSDEARRFGWVLAAYYDGQDYNIF